MLAQIKKAVPKPVYFQVRNSIFGNFWRSLSGKNQVINRKVGYIRKFQKQFGLKTLVETGTYFGDTLWQVKGDFSTIYSIELDESLHQFARRKFARYPHIHLVQGDSAIMLPRVLEKVNEPSLLWLDAHWSGGVTSKGSEDSAVSGEMRAIQNHPIHGHVILIDDISSFGDQKETGYPTVKALEDFLHGVNPNYRIEIKDDMAMAYPGR